MTNRIGKIFPIKTATACQLKWNWSTIYLNSGITSSCHRTGESVLSLENFDNFHNTELKLQDRQMMLAGQWPKSSCEYCKKIELTGGVSDRIRHLTLPHAIPKELELDPTAVSVTPTILEVFFNNTCNLSCVYCNETLSSSIQAENKKFGSFVSGEVKIVEHKIHYKNLIDPFWKWFETGFKEIKEFKMLGGETFYQKELNQFLEYVDKYPNPDCVVSIVTNLMVDKSKLQNYIQKFKHLIINKKLKRFDLIVSIDCWGPEAEYVRHGLDLAKWEENFEFLLENKWLYVSINQTISALTIKSMPQLLRKLKEWRKVRNIGHWFGSVVNAGIWLQGETFGETVFKQDTDEILQLMPQDTEENKNAYNYMNGIFTVINSTKTPDLKNAANLIVYLNEMDQRRGTDWRTTFTWLKQFDNVV
jgi:hypothetical protein